MKTSPLRAEDPRQIGAYRLLERLGEGGMGSVFLGQSESGRRVAVKIVKPGYSSDPEFRARFRGEVQRARQVPPFCTAEILDADPEHETPYLVAELVEGPSLQEVVRDRGVLTDGNLYSIAIGVATALVAIHEAGVVHRDLTPSNVLFALGAPKVIDFGIAKGLDTTDHHILPGHVLGTVAYMGPERFDAESAAAVGPATDIFAWGAVVTYAATGRPPHTVETMVAAAAGVPLPDPDLSELPRSLRGLVASALCPDPSARPSAHELLDRLLKAGAAGDSRVRAGLAERPEVRRAAAALQHTAPFPLPQTSPPPTLSSPAYPLSATSSSSTAPSSSPASSAPSSSPAFPAAAFPGVSAAASAVSPVHPSSVEIAPFSPGVPSSVQRATASVGALAAVPADASATAPVVAPAAVSATAPAGAPVAGRRGRGFRAFAVAAALVLACGTGVLADPLVDNLLQAQPAVTPSSLLSSAIAGREDAGEAPASRGGKRGRCTLDGPLRVLSTDPQAFTCPAVLGTGSQSIEAEVSLDSSSACAAVWLHTAADDAYRISLCSAHLSLTTEHADHARALASDALSGRLPANTWHHLAIHATATDLTITLDHTQVLSHPHALPTPPTGQVILGLDPTSATSPQSTVTFAEITVTPS
ncbi:protein kinase [Actinoplanes sp. NPDC051851]|uniref:protein kinase domain-containing protein n=1 Tax=Actinoplanes sp. NPDC051851 TaxID=3154753 RepID=UPI00344185E7